MSPRVDTAPRRHTIATVCVALVVAAASLAACGGGSDDATTGTAPAASSVASAPATVEAAATVPSVATTDPVTTDAPANTDAASGDGGEVAGAELVCPAVATALGIVDDAGWGPGAGTHDASVKASLSASLVIDLTPDLPFEQVQALWDAADSIAATGCPDDAQRLAAVYGGSSLRDILDAA